ncbi:gene transfer agent family protein [Rhizobium lentis]|uniref:gene transfer agent family protein n=1 Tax=Rhizobium lentis TaxID=1138194 RepID=UPI001C83A250|nr:gene transfer agent family protein [Rhizobium lentis]MBX5149564.1 gene transfer agent family protein [Rhizobium lentis]
MRKPFTQFFGEADHSFHLEPSLVLELERRLGSGIGAIYRRFISADFGFADLTQVIRLGLIGGGMEPKNAAELVEVYGARMSVSELYMVALPVMEALMTGDALQRVAKSPRKRKADR